jgi:hypothetical protein
MRLPMPAEVRALLDAADERFRPFVAPAAFAGLRLGEAAAVRVGDVNFLGRTLQLSRQVQRGTGGTVQITPPKYGSERTVFSQAPWSSCCRCTSHRSATGCVAVLRDRRQPTAPEHGWLLVAHDLP